VTRQATGSFCYKILATWRSAIFISPTRSRVAPRHYSSKINKTLPMPRAEDAATVYSVNMWEGANVALEADKCLNKTWAMQFLTEVRHRRLSTTTTLVSLGLSNKRLKTKMTFPVNLSFYLKPISNFYFYNSFYLLKEYVSNKVDQVIIEFMFIAGLQSFFSLSRNIQYFCRYNKSWI